MGLFILRHVIENMAKLGIIGGVGRIGVEVRRKLITEDQSQFPQRLFAYMRMPAAVWIEGGDTFGLDSGSRANDAIDNDVIMETRSACSR